MSALTYDHGSAINQPRAGGVHRQGVRAHHDRGGITARRLETHAATPAGAQLLAEVNSPPMSVMTRLMDVPSDDLFAEMFTKQLGVLFGEAARSRRARA